MPHDDFTAFVLDQLHALGPIIARSMFGAYGLYHRGAFFAISSGGRLYFKTIPATRADYERHGMQPFRPNARQTLVNYYEVPADILEDSTLLARWARAALGLPTHNPD